MHVCIDDLCVCIQRLKDNLRFQLPTSFETGLLLAWSSPIESCEMILLQRRVDKYPISSKGLGSFIKGLDRIILDPLCALILGYVFSSYSVHDSHSQ